jgi:branched-subunit amino acid transport protein
MNLLDDGFGGYLVLLLIAVLAHEPWRWLGLILARNLTADSEIFIWVRAVATALVAGLVMRLVVFPAGALGDVPLPLRLIALVGAIAVFFATRRNLGVGIVSGAALLVALKSVMG